MADDERTMLQNMLAERVARSEQTRDHYDSLLRAKLETTGKPLWDIERGKVRRPSPRVLGAIEEVLGYRADHLVNLVHPRPGSVAAEQGEGRGGSPSEAAPLEDPDLVSIQQIDLAFGMGATFTDNPVAVDVLRFPKVWVETITRSPPTLLTWSTGRGDSMSPTINDGDIVLLDRSQRKVREQDAIWAFTVGDVGSIKRLRVKGDRFVIMSDNPSVPDDEEPIDFVNVIARVIFVGIRK